MSWFAVRHPQSQHVEAQQRLSDLERLEKVAVTRVISAGARVTVTADENRQKADDIVKQAEIDKPERTIQAAEAALRILHERER
jgi:hypothetical protein